MSRVLEKWYVSLIIIPILLTYLTNYFTIPLLTSDWKIAIIFSLSITVIILLLEINGYNVEVDPSAGHTDPANKAFFSPTDDLTILLLFS